MVSNQSLYKERWEVVHDNLRREILEGKRQPASRIIETEVAEKYGVSRGPVREAIRVLEVAGLVVRLPRQATFVTPVTKRDVEELYSLRESLEVMAVERAIERSGSGLDKPLSAQLEQLRDGLKAGEYTAVVDADIAFHSVFYDAADHTRLAAVWKQMQDPLRIFVSLTARRGDRDWDGTVQGHVEIMNAAAKANTAKCVSATRDHLARARDLVLAFVAEHEFDRLQ